MATVVSFVHSAQCRAHQFKKGQGVVLLVHNKSQQYSADGHRAPSTWLLHSHSKVAAVLRLYEQKEKACIIWRLNGLWDY